MKNLNGYRPTHIQSYNDRCSDKEVNLDSFDDVCDTLFHHLKYTSIPEKQKYIKNLIISIYVEERRRATVNGRIPLVTEAQNIQDVLISRDSYFDTPTFKFYFKLDLPEK